jgi:hypothetical protein
VPKRDDGPTEDRKKLGGRRIHQALFSFIENKISKIIERR